MGRGEPLERRRTISAGLRGGVQGWQSAACRSARLDRCLPPSCFSLLLWCTARWLREAQKNKIQDRHYHQLLSASQRQDDSRKRPLSNKNQVTYSFLSSSFLSFSLSSTTCALTNS